jgi:UDP-N-acetylmuramyl pentapeptide phosphotransferase/UDP-N-acetylglucosamine-1-phosphate transferase
VNVICVIFFEMIYLPSSPEKVFIALSLFFIIQLIEYNAALASICFMIFLGFVDDVVDLKWRYKLVLPTIASLPLLMAYAGPTVVVIPDPFHHFVGKLVELGLPSPSTADAKVFSTRST